MQTLRAFIIAAPGCNAARNASHYVKRDGITYVAQSPRALAILTGEYIPPRPASGIRPGIMRALDQFRRNCRAIMRERNCNYQIAAAIVRRNSRAH